jgi:hypothetical protein
VRTTAVLEEWLGFGATAIADLADRGVLRSRTPADADKRQRSTNALAGGSALAPTAPAPSPPGFLAVARSGRPGTCRNVCDQVEGELLPFID